MFACAWQECARYLETFKAYENKPAGAIQERVDTDYLGRLTSVLTSVRGVNRNDAATLARRFGTFADMLKGEEAEFSACPGLGPTKVGMGALIQMRHGQLMQHGQLSMRGSRQVLTPAAMPAAASHAVEWLAGCLPNMQIELQLLGATLCSSFARGCNAFECWFYVPFSVHLQVRRLRDTFNEPFRKAVGVNAGAGQAPATGGSQAGPSNTAGQQQVPPQQLTAPGQQQQQQGLATGSRQGQQSEASQDQLGTQAPLDLDLDDDIEDLDTDDELMGM